MATHFYPAPGIAMIEFVRHAQLASLSDETPEGRSIVVLAKEQYSLRAETVSPHELEFVPFSATTRMSGVNFKEDGREVQVRKGALDAIRTFVGGKVEAQVESTAGDIGRRGGTPLVVCEGRRMLGVIELKDVVKGGIRERFAELRKMGIRTVMITGDNPLTAASIAAEAGVDDFMAQATPEQKLIRIRQEQAAGHLVAMTGDGTNDAPALAQADVGVAMNTGTQAAREAGNMVDLDSNPTKLIEIVEIGKQLLMTRGSLTTFSVANDVAKYFAILPALFGSLYALNGPGPLAALNVMGLGSARSAILSAIIFNALVIVALIPLAMRGVRYRALGASMILRRNLLIYGLGGLVSPFIGIKLIDLGVTALHLV
jgi:K+-transporting ATPase ATPase B chain